MGEILVRSGSIIIDGAPPYNIPELNKHFLDSFLTTQPGEEGFVGDVMKHFTEQEKLDVKLAAKRIGGPTWAAFCKAAAKWAPIVNQDNLWHLEDFVLIYKAKLNASWAESVIITNANIRFVITPERAMSFPEFRFHYGIDIVSHIDNHEAQVVGNLNSVRRHITGELVKKTLLVSDARENLVKKVFPVLETLPPDLWVLPNGYTFVALAEDD